MIIRQDDLLQDILDYLPANNSLSDRQLNKISKIVIEAVGDEEANYQEILCKSLLAAAKLNKARSVGDQDLRREEVGMEEYEYFKKDSTSEKAWEKYINQLPNICMLFGYNDLEPELVIPVVCSTPKIKVDNSCQRVIKDEHKGCC